jgi:hypothetical protein
MSAHRLVCNNAPLCRTDLAMTDTERPALPDRLAIDSRSPHHNAQVLAHSIGIRLNGRDRHDVEEYCISEGWIRVPAGKTVDRRGQPLLIKVKGQVEVYYKA